MKSYISRLPVSGKVAITLYILLLWYGYILAVINTNLAVGLSPESVAEHYRGEPASISELGKIEKKGFVEEEINIGDEDEEEHGEGIISPQEIVQLGHIHMLGFSLIFVSLSLILAFSGSVGEAVKIIIMVIFFLSFAFDIGGLLLTRFVSPHLALTSVISGIATGICMGIITLVALYDMWIKRAE